MILIASSRIKHLPNLHGAQGGGGRGSKGVFTILTPAIVKKGRDDCFGGTSSSLGKSNIIVLSRPLTPCLIPSGAPV